MACKQKAYADPLALLFGAALDLEAARFLELLAFEALASEASPVGSELAFAFAFAFAAEALAWAFAAAGLAHFKALPGTLQITAATHAQTHTHTHTCEQHMHTRTCYNSFKVSSVPGTAQDNVETAILLGALDEQISKCLLLLNL